ncbi:MAG: proline racemase family protein [Rhodoblastus sp.]|nr:MAG: proline racemase family protein [Rhodoblastus sp.]
MAGPPRDALRLDVVDMHTAGEPARIVLSGYPRLEGATILDKRRDALARCDHLRRVMMHEPRGHAGMYGVIPVEPSEAAKAQGASLACLFTHASGYSTMCGHATIAFARFAVERGLVATPAGGDGVARFGLELPCGVVAVEARLEGGAVVASAFESVPAFVAERDASIDVAGIGRVVYDVVFGGAFYAILPSRRLGLAFDAPLAERVGAGMTLFRALRAERPAPLHPDEPDLSFLYGVILTDDASPPAPTRNLCMFGEGQIDRSPTGSGVTARMALDLLAGRLEEGAARRFAGPTGDVFVGSARRDGEVAGRPAVRVRVEGRAFHVGEARLRVEPDDPLGSGFLLFEAEAG